jgi:glycerol-3-phosphate dehydrogenase
MLKRFFFNKNVKKMFSTTDYDVCVIGGGPAGTNILT